MPDKLIILCTIAINSTPINLYLWRLCHISEASSQTFPFIANAGLFWQARLRHFVTVLRLACRSFVFVLADEATHHSDEPLWGVAFMQALALPRNKGAFSARNAQLSKDFWLVLALTDNPNRSLSHRYDWQPCKLGYIWGKKGPPNLGPIRMRHDGGSIMV